MDPLEPTFEDKEIKETVVMKDPMRPSVTKTISRVTSPSGTVEVVNSSPDPLHVHHAQTGIGSEHVVSSQRIEEPSIKTEHPQQVYDTKKTIIRFNQVVWAILAMIEFLLGFRVTLKALGANPGSLFVDIIYTLSYPFAFPFLGIIRTDVSGRGSVFEWSTIVGGIVYFILAYAAMQLITFTKPITPRDTRFV